MKPRPVHLSDAQAAQFGEQSVVDAYRARPPYPPAVFDALVQSMPAGPRRVLELGSGSGDLTIGLAARVEHVDAVEAAAAMLTAARARAPRDAPIRWVHARAEDFAYDGDYALAVAAESIHWMDWARVLPTVAGCLRPGATLAVVTGRSLSVQPWDGELRRLIARCSTNRDYAPYDIVQELTSRGLFRETRRLTTTAVPFAQSVDDYVLSFHSRNGFSRERMGAAAADAFDAELRALLRAHAPDGVVRAQLSATLVWGIPCPAAG